MPQVSTRLGDRRGPLIGIIAASVRRPVMFDTHYSTEVKKASGLVPIVGRQGAGKSVLEAAICYQAAHPPTGPHPAPRQEGPLMARRREEPRTAQLALACARSPATSR